jgi:4,5-DOPA dioxygenase extradiol
MADDSAAMPAIFFGHGSPMNAIETNRYTEAWRKIGRLIKKPRAVLAISAHWYVPTSAVTSMDKPPTLHDFGGFPPELHALEYPAPGDPELANRVRSLLAPLSVALDDTSWGLDHGTWSVLVHLFPEADVPVIQLSMDSTLPPIDHFELAHRLAPLRDSGVLIAGFGNVVHNLRMMQRKASAPPYDWAVRFNDRIRGLVESGSYDGIVGYRRLSEDARLAVPTPEHYLPLLYVLAQQRPEEKAQIIIDGIEMGSVSMLSAAVGLQQTAL